jgi:uncharacterized protein
MLQTTLWRLPGLRAAGLTLALTAALAGPLGLGVGLAQETPAPPPPPVAPPPVAFGVPTVSVSGHGEVNVPPDTASVNIGVDVIKPTLDEAQDEATAQATAVIDALKDAGVADEDIQTDYYSVNILRDYSENADPTLITGFEIINQLRITVRDTDTLGDLLDAAVNAGANNIYGVTFYVEDQTAAASEARVEAVDDARVKAEELAQAAGMTLGPVVAISEGVAPFVSPVYGMARGGGDMAMEQAAVPVEAGSTTVSVDVSVTYELQ